MRWVVEALCLSLSRHGFTASESAVRSEVLNKQGESEYGVRRAAVSEETPGEKIVRRMGQARRYAFNVQRTEGDDHVVASQKQTIKPLLADAQDLRASRGGAESQNPR